MDSRITALMCSECGTGHYFETTDYVFECDRCGHTITPADLVLDEGEHWSTDDAGILVVIAEEA